MKHISKAPWKALGSRLAQQIAQDSLPQAAAALAFFAMLSLFPLLIFLLSAVPYLPIEGIEPAIMGFFKDLLPKQGARLVEGTVKQVVHQQRPNLLSLGLVGATWFASAAMHSAMVQIDKTFGLQKPQPFVKARLRSLGLTFLLALLVLAAIIVIILNGKLQSAVAAGDFAWCFQVTRWVLIVGFLMLGFGLVYYCAPVVRQKFAWVSPGAIIGVALLLLASLGFRFYVRNFANYQVIYGALGTVIVLMVWLYVCAMALLIGSEVNVTLAAESPSPDGSRNPVAQSKREPLLR